MKKLVIVINGAGAVGKDTLCDMAAERFSVKNVSSITPIKEIAKNFGWNGEKDDKARRFLSRLKEASIEYNDYPTAWGLERYREFLGSDEDVMFVHIREPIEIKKFKDGTLGKAKTLLVRGGERMSKTHYGNVSDDSVENYEYDYYFMNDKSLDEARVNFIALLGEMLDKEEEI